MALTQAQLAHIDKITPEIRSDMAGYLAAGAEVVIRKQDEVSDAGAFAIEVVHSDFWIDCCATHDEAQRLVESLGLRVTS